MYLAPVDGPAPSAGSSDRAASGFRVQPSRAVGVRKIGALSHKRQKQVEDRLALLGKPRRRIQLRARFTESRQTRHAPHLAERIANQSRRKATAQKRHARY